MALNRGFGSDRRKPRKIRHIQVISVLILSLAGVINYIDRGSLAIANTTVRAELGISATRMGVLLSIFSLTYALAQLPMGILLDRFGERVVLGVGMLFWSLTQTATGLVSGFRSFAAARMGLAIGESPFVVAAVKTVHDWFDVRDRATPMGIVNSATTLGQAIAPPILTVTMLAFGWRAMFVLIGIPGTFLSIGWYWFYRDRKSVTLDHVGAAHRPDLDYSRGRSSDHRAHDSLAHDSLAHDSLAHHSLPRVPFSTWAGLFRLRSIWGMMLGFGGINYTVWLYMSWMPNYLEAEHHVSVASTGTLAILPFLMGAVGMMLSGVLADLLVRRGTAPIKTHKTLLVTGLTCSGLSTLLVPYVPSATGAAVGIGAALFFTYLAGNSGWGLVQSMAPAELVASVGTIQNFGSFICASFAPVLTGWLLDRTHSFHLTLVVCSLVSVFGALCYLFIVKDPIRIGTDPRTYPAAY